MYDTMTVSSLDGLCDFFRRVVGTVPGQRLRPWFRGHARSSWNLVPWARRDFTRAVETSMTNTFMVEAPARHTGCPEHGDLISWLCFMRHYGLPTRLLDWTTSLLVAAYFAVCETDSDGGAAIWALRPEVLNEVQIDERVVVLLGGTHPLKRHFTAAFNSDVASDKVFAFISPHIDPRMMLQQAAFTIHGTDSPLEEADQCERFLLKAEIPADARDVLKYQIAALGIRRPIIFPGLADLAQDLAQSVLDE